MGRILWLNDLRIYTDKLQNLLRNNLCGYMCAHERKTISYVEGFKVVTRGLKQRNSIYTMYNVHDSIIQI